MPVRVLTAPVVGVDGCRGSWLAATVVGDERAARLVGWELGRFADVLARAGDATVVAVDIPVGLATAGRRPCDVAGRAALGGRAAARLFLVPPRYAVEAPTYADANDLLRGRGEPAVSRQTYALAAAVLEVDAAVERRGEEPGCGDDPSATMSTERRGEEPGCGDDPSATMSTERRGEEPGCGDDPSATMSTERRGEEPGCGDDPRVHEVHPDLSFLAMTGRVLDTKHTRPGLAQRTAALSGWLDVEAATSSAPPRARRDDVLDALAAAWTATRIRDGTAVVYPAGATARRPAIRA